MKKIILPAAVVIGLIMISVILVACSKLLTAPSEAVSKTTVTPLIPGPYPTDRVPPDKTYYRKRCWPACHYSSAWLSDDPNLVTSDFDAILEGDWVWVNEDPDHWTLSDVSGVLRIVSHGSFTGEESENTLVKDAPTGFFDVVTQVTFMPTTEDQKAGIFIQFEDGGIISLSRGYCQEGGGPPCVGDGVFFEGKGIDCKQSSVPTAVDTVNLMLRKAGNEYVGYYGEGDNLSPEAAWVEVGRCYAFDEKPSQVGLFVTGGEIQDTPDTPADFELVTLVERK